MADEIEPGAPRYPGPSRRTFLKGAAVGAGAMFVAPTVLSMPAPPLPPARPAAAAPPPTQLRRSWSAPYVQVQFFNGSTAVGAPIVAASNSITPSTFTVTGPVPEKATAAIVTVYLQVFNLVIATARGTARNVSLRLQCS